MSMVEDGTSHGRERKDFFDAAEFDGFFGHAEDDATGFVLCHGDGASLFISSIPRAPSSPIPVRMTPTAF